MDAPKIAEPQSARSSRPAWRSHVLAAQAPVAAPQMTVQKQEEPMRLKGGEGVRRLEDTWIAIGAVATSSHLERR